MAEHGVGQQIVELQHELGDDADAATCGLGGGYLGLDGQLPAAALGIADTRSNQRAAAPSAWFTRSSRNCNRVYASVTALAVGQC